MFGKTTFKENDDCLIPILIFSQINLKSKVISLNEKLNDLHRAGTMKHDLRTSVYYFEPF